MQPRIEGSNGKIVIKIYTVFGKGEKAEFCPNCRENKFDNFNLLSDFFGGLLPYLIDLHANASLGVLYDSRNSEDKLELEVSFSDLLNTSNDHEEQGFRFTLLQGAKRVTFHVQFCRNVEDYD